MNANPMGHFMLVVSIIVLILGCGLMASSPLAAERQARQVETDTPTLVVSPTLTLTMTLELTISPTETSTATATPTQAIGLATLTATEPSPTETATATATPAPSATPSLGPSLTPIASPVIDDIFIVYLPKILKEVWSPDMGGTGERRYTSYSITNLATCPTCMALAIVEYFDLTGRLVITEFHNILPGDVIIINQKTNYDMPPGIYSAMMRVNQPIAILVSEAVLSPQLYTPPFAFPFSTYTGSVGGANQLVLPQLLYNWFDTNSTAYIQNTSDTPAHIEIRFAPQIVEGTPIGPAAPPILTYTLMPLTSTVLDMRILATLAAPLGRFEGRFRGAAFITSDQPLAAVVTDSNFVSHVHSSYPGFRDIDMGVDLLAPQVMFAYDNSFASVNIFNPSLDHTVAVTITYTADSTSRAYTTEPVEGRQVEVTFVVEPRSTDVRYLGNASVGDLYRNFSRFRGTARVRASGPIVGWVTQEAHYFGAATTPLNAYPIPPINQLTSGIRLPIVKAENNGEYTRITCANSSSIEPAPIRIWYQSDAYSLPPSASLYFDHILAPAGSLTRDESERDGPFADLNVYERSNRFNGTAYITSLSNIPITCIVSQVHRHIAPDNINIYSGIATMPYVLPSPTPTLTPTPTKTSTVTPTPTVTPPVYLRLPLVLHGRETYRWVWRPYPLPPSCCEGLYGVAMVSETDGWAVGYGGVILRWNGSAWITWASPTTKQLNAVTLVSATEGWAVGADGEMIRWNGQTWTRVTSPTQATLHGIFMLSAREGWAVGDMGTILRWNGQVWTSVASPTTYGLKSVSIVSASDGWIVGDGGTILRWNGSAWSIAGAARVGLRSVAMRSATEGMAVGNVYSYGRGCDFRGCDYYYYFGVSMRWNGQAWAEILSPSTLALNAVTIASLTNIWAVGDEGSTIYWGGRGWAKVSSPTRSALYGVAATPGGTVWAVGAPGVILRAALEQVPWPE